MKNGNCKRVPAGLSREAQALFEQTVQMYDIDDPPSLVLLTNAALALDRLRRAEAVVAKEGSTFRDRFNQIKSHPACARIDAENGTIARCLRELGLDLSAVAVSGSRPPEGV
jgi:Phage terminase, small subunit